MYCITDDQIDYILNDIRRNGVETEDLQLNLLDHICCIIEQNLEDNGDFEGFYQHTIRRFYKTELKEIEEETIHLLTFKNYEAMKKLMIGSGALSVLALLTGSFFKIMYWPGASMLLFLGMVFFSLLFLPVVYMMKVRETKTAGEKLTYAVATFVGILYCMSALFKVQHWPGANIMIFSTLILGFFVVLPMYFFNGIRRPETKLNTIVVSIIFVGVLGVQFTMTAIRVRVPRTEQPSTVQQVSELPQQLSSMAAAE